LANSISTTILLGDNDSGTTWYGLTLDASDNSIIGENTIFADSSATKSSTIYGLNCNGPVGGSGKNIGLSRNIISITANDSASAIIRAISIYTIDDSLFDGNSILVVPHGTPSNNHYGLYIGSSDRNVIAKNNMNITTNTANDIGIYLDASTNNNQGGDNITYNAGSGIVDSGTGNSVTGKDV